MNEVMNTILHRRSIRKFTEQQLSEEHLGLILEAGEYAPCAGGRQSPVFVVCQDAALNDEIGKINLEKLKEIMSVRPPMDPKDKDGNAPSLPAGASLKSVFNNAPTVITVFAPKDWYNFDLDAAVAAENMMLAADSLGVGSCLIARATEVFATERGKEIQAQWGIGEEFEAKLHVILGYPAGPIPEPKPRKAGRVIRV